VKLFESRLAATSSVKHKTHVFVEMDFSPPHGFPCIPNSSRQVSGIGTCLLISWNMKVSTAHVE
jgi:hypothetical protein